VRRHWTINGRFLAQPATGVQRYAHEIVRALDRRLAEDPALARTLTVEIVAPPDAAADLPLEAIAIRKAGRFGGHPWEQAVLPMHARGGLLSLCNTGPVAHRRQIVCIHDMNTRLCPESYSRAFRTLYRALLPALGRTARAVATVSAFSADEIAAAGIRQRREILLIPNGHEHVARWRPDEASCPPEVRRKTIVVIGSPAPHKNLGLVIGLAECLAAAGLRLAVIGSADAKVYRNVRERDRDGVAWLGRLSDVEMAAELRDCLCLAFPSLTEGFGMPPLEAMALGCPVVASDRASIPEVCGEAALYAAPDDPEAWLRHFLALRDSPDLREALARRGRARARAFSWEDSAARYLEAMAAADGVAA
jgi:glycosyltransferase involved in cell wall biosynthesis